MYYPIEDIDGLGDRLSSGLERAGVKTTRDLLERVAHADDRDRLARALGVEISELTRAVEIADLLRVRGVAKRFAALLHAAGVRSVRALRAQDATALFEAIREAKTRVKLAYRLPTLDNVTGWIEDAALLQDGHN
jgi:nucleotidyltransferase/DNA polymerase involved in DNA repair